MAKKDVKTYGQWGGIVLIVLAILGFMGMLGLSRVSTWLYLILGLWGAWGGFKGAAAGQETFSKVAGVVLLIVGVLGFFMPTVLGMTLDTTQNIINLVLGAWGCWAGFKK